MTVHITLHHGDPPRGRDTGSSGDDLEGDDAHSRGGPAAGGQEPNSLDNPDGRADERCAESDVPVESTFGPSAEGPVPSMARLGAAAARDARQPVPRTEKVRALGQMASGVAHDLNQSFALIAGYAELLERDLAGPSPDPRRLREYAAVMREAAIDGGEMARRLLSVSRVPAQGAAVPVAATALLRDVARLTVPRWREATRAAGHPVSLSIRADGDAEALAVLGWSSSLREALTNLVLNAVDALPRGGEICLGARRDGDWVELLVADTGIGMPPEVRARIFEPFFTTKGERGTGLGLAQVFAIVQQHGGEITVRSAPGRGTTFTLCLPAASPAGDERGTDNRPQESAGAPLRVLAVDDDPAHGRMLAAMLGHDGHQVTVVSSAETALERLTVGEFDVVVSDLGLGAGPDGWQLAECVRRDRPDVRVCLVTGWGEDIDPAEAAERGVFAVLAKPYALNDLLAVVGARRPPTATRLLHRRRNGGGGFVHARQR